MLYDKIELESDEKVLLETRRHWFVLFGQLLPLFMAAVVPILFAYYAAAHISASPLAINPENPHVWYGYALWLLFLWMGIFNVWTNHYLDVLIATNKRVIIINQKGFWRRNIASFRLERLQDLNAEIDGFFATLLDYGTLNAETAGHGEEEFNVYGMPHPREIKAVVIAAVDNLIEKTYPRQAPAMTPQEAL
jgi:hypothetical protein